MGFLSNRIFTNWVFLQFGIRAWQSSKNQSIGWLSTSNRSSDETTDYQRLITPNNHFLVGSDWFPTIAIAVEKSGNFTVVGCRLRLSRGLPYPEHNRKIIVSQLS